MNWHRLDREKTIEIINTVQNGTDLSLFNPKTSEVKCASLPFYRNFLQYRLTNYASLPCFTFDYLGNGEKFYHLNGEADTIYKINEQAHLNLNIKTVMPYLRFFLDNVSIDDGEVYLVENTDDLSFIDSMGPDQKKHLEDHFEAPAISYEPTLSAFIVKCTLYFMGILMHTSIRIGNNGVVSILDQTMLMQSHIHSEIRK